MADIAILIAEEYERRVKNSRQRGEEIELLSCVGFLGADLKHPTFPWVKQKINFVQEVKSIKAGIILGELKKPRSEMSLAASNGFFSA